MGRSAKTGSVGMEWPICIFVPSNDLNVQLVENKIVCLTYVSNFLYSQIKESYLWLKTDVMQYFFFVPSADCMSYRYILLSVILCITLIKVWTWFIFFVAKFPKHFTVLPALKYGNTVCKVSQITYGRVGNTV